MSSKKFKKNYCPPYQARVGLYIYTILATSMHEDELTEMATKYQELEQHLGSQGVSSECYPQVHELITYIMDKTGICSADSEEGILILGKTGSGKSTTINFLDQVQLRPDEEYHLVPVNEEESRTKIGNGYTSTTLIPVACKTHFGRVFDLAGDDDARGMVVELLNSIYKKNMSQGLRKIKLVFVIPASNFMSSGGYGKAFKEVLDSNNKFLGNLNQFKESSLLVVSFANRTAKELDRIKKYINECLKQQDKRLEPYAQLINYLLQNDRIKLFAAPSPQNTQGYTVPQFEEWSSFSPNAISEAIGKFPYRQCSQFCVPFNPDIALTMENFLQVVVLRVQEKVAKAFTKLEISGIELNKAQEYLLALVKNEKTTLDKFVALMETNHYFKVPSLEEESTAINFLAQFLDREADNSNIFIHEWVNEQLSNRAFAALNEIKQLKIEKKPDFLKQARTPSLSIQPNYPKFKLLETDHNALLNLYNQEETLVGKKNNQSSEYYETYTQKVFDKKVKEDYEVDEEYIDYQTQLTEVQVPRTVTRQVPMPRTRTAYRSQTETYTESVPKTKKVTKYNQQVVTHYGGKIFGFFGGRHKWQETVNIPYEVDEVYYENEQRTRVVQVPYTEGYTEYVTQSQVVYEKQRNSEQVPVKKMRKKTMQRDVDTYKDEQKKRFLLDKFNKDLDRSQALTSAQETKLRQQVSASQQEPVENLLQRVENLGVDRPVYKEIMELWNKCEHSALKASHPERYLNI